MPFNFITSEIIVPSMSFDTQEIVTGSPSVNPVLGLTVNVTVGFWFSVIVFTVTEIELVVNPP